MNTQISSYEQQALDFLNTTATVIAFKYVKFDFHFDGDKERRAIWDISLTNQNATRTFRFGASIAQGNKQPTAYDLLACLQKYDPGTFEEFCNEFGATSRRLYKAVVAEWNKVQALFNENEIEQLQEIQ